MDLITYNCLEVSPRLRVRECAVGEGAFAGSSKIDRNFAEFFKSRMGRHFESLRLETQQKVVKNFEEIKCGFRDRPDQQIYTVSIFFGFCVIEMYAYELEYRSRFPQSTTFRRLELRMVNLG